MDWNLSLIAPELTLLITALVVMLAELPLRRRDPSSDSQLSPVLTIVGMLAALVLLFLVGSGDGRLIFSRHLIMDGMAFFLRALFLGIGLGTLLIALPYLKRENLYRLEFLVLILFSVLGMMLMVASADLITFFLALELLSMGLYVLAGYQRRQKRSVEAALKYFLLGAFASAVLLMGLALQWGSTGTLHLAHGAMNAGGGVLNPTLARAGFWLVLAGLAFKVSIVPFHFWTADVYEGAPAPVAAFMATGTKAAAVAALLRLLTTGFAPDPSEWLPVLWWLAVLTMSVGNLMAIVQSNIKRMLAFSSVAHAGYLLVALVAGSGEATSALLFYLVAYTLMNLGAFAVATLVGRHREAHQNIFEDYSGLARSHPWLAAAMAVFLFGLAGIPPTVGFTGKLLIFAEAMRAGYVGLVIIAVLNSLLSVYYYIRVIYLMYMKEAWEEQAPLPVPLATALLLVIAVLGVLGLGILPGGLLDAAAASARLF